MTTPAPISRRLYVQKLLEVYRLVPGTSEYRCRCDRKLAGELHDRGIPLAVVQAAILLAVARRTFRPANAPPLAPIATLHYFRPVIDEMVAHPLDPHHLGYIRYKLSAVAPELAVALEHQLP